MSKQEPIQVAGFEILTKLSSGGMGDVLLARRRGVGGFEKLLAVKTIRGDLARRPDIRAMFLDEARLVARLDHPAIAHVYDFGEHDGALYLAMEFVHGVALNKLLVKRQKELPPTVAARIAAEACRGLHAAHQLTDNDGHALGVVHRDVSPGNIILTYDAHVKILDFGIAFMNSRESPDTQMGELKGKPSYMSPEQLRCERVDRRSDLYSLSVVLHEMLTGRKLFSRQNVVATALAVERGEAPPPRSINPQVPEALDQIVMKGLANRADDRYPDARTMAQALDEVLSTLKGPSLEQFIEEELGEDTALHKGWLHSALNGEGETDKSFDSWRPAALAAPIATTPGRADGPTRDLQPQPLVESVTLVPPAPTADRAPTHGGPRLSPTAAALGIFLAAVGVFLGYRWFVPEPLPDVPIAPLPVVEAPAAKIVEPPVAEAPVEPKEVAEAPPPEEDADRPKPKRPARPSRPSPTPERNERPAPEPAQKGAGFLTVGAQPYALVKIDGQQVGTTPIMRHKLGAGSHKVELLRPDTGEVRHTQTVDVKDGEHQRITLQ